MEDGMNCIYEIRYEVQWQASTPAHWEAQKVRVSSREDAQEAIDRARKAALAQHRLDENGLEEQCTLFRLREVVLLAEAEL
jgi:hypothetical protein